MADIIGFDVVFRHLWLITWVIPPTILVFALMEAYDYRRAKYELGKNTWLQRLHKIEASPQMSAHVWRFLGVSAIFALLVLVAAEPERKEVSREPIYGSVRVTFLPDVSKSMKYAQDVHPFPDRLVAAKAVMADFATMTEKDPDMRGLYQFAVIPFAGAAQTLLPFTKNRQEFIDTVDDLDESSIGKPGTNLLFPIMEYRQLLREYPRDVHTLDIAVLISDGGKGEDAHKDLPRIKLERMRMPGVVLYTVGIGSRTETTLADGTVRMVIKAVPLKRYDAKGVFIDYERKNPDDPKSEILSSELDERLLIEVSGDASRYFFYQGKDRLLQELKKLIIDQRIMTGEVTRERFTPVGYWFLLMALAIALVLSGYAKRLFFLLATPLRSIKRRVAALG